ncbi:YadA-like family protein [Pseudomonas sp. CGJS7]|uniref:YadA-like family protein n=1 Tax=Pseudomonas sp. CGJS7 TaxID=3109348 RepID=UPI00300ADB24
MNKVYSLVWNSSLQQMVVASELASSQIGGRASGGRCMPRSSVLAAALAGLLAAAGPAQNARAQAAWGTGNQGAVIVGNSAVASGSGAIAIGSKGSSGLTTTASNSEAVAIGNGAFASGGGSTALGLMSKATGQGAYAMGYESLASGAGSVAMGYQAKSIGANSLAFGASSIANNANDVALGPSSVTAAAVGTAKVVIGGTTYNFAGTAPGSVVSIGAVGSERQLINVAAGRLSATSTDAINGSQLFATNQVVDGIMTKGGKYFHVNSVAADSTATGKDSIAIGPNAVAGNTNDVALGSGSVTAAAIGTASAVIAGTTYNFAGTAPGSVVSVGAAGAERQVLNVAAGRLSASSTDAVNGSQLFATNKALGDINNKGIKYFRANSTLNDSTPTGTDSVAIGASAVATKAGDVALGSGAVTAAANATPDLVINGKTYNFAGAAPTSVVSVGTDGAERQITNVAAGRVDGGSTDAINGSQLFATNTELGAVNDRAKALGDNTASAFGGGAAYDAKTGKLSAPAYTIGADTYDNVGDALGKLANGGARTKYFNVNSTLADSVATGADSVAIGPNASAAGVNAVALGRASAASKEGAMALGANSIASGSFSLAQGVDAQASGDLAISVGQGSVSSGSGGVAVGAGADAGQDGALALGSGALAGQAYAVALGTGSTTSVANATTGAIINGTTYKFAGTAPSSVVSVGVAGGERQIINVAAGRVDAASADAINGSQLFATNTELGAVNDRASALGDNVATAFGGGAAYDAKTGKLSAPAYAIGTDTYDNVGDALSKLANGGARTKYFNVNSTLADSVAAGADSVAIGPNASSASASALAIGAGSVASGMNAVALGSGSSAKAADSFALGSGSVASDNNTIALGLNAAASSVDAVALGTGSAASRDGSVALGANSIASGGFSFAQGVAAKASGDLAISMGLASASSGLGSVAIGSEANAGQDGAVALGTGSKTSAANATTSAVINGTTYNFAGAAPNSVVSVGAVGAERQITNVAAGRVDAASTDAVNGSQLFATNTELGAVNDRAKALGDNTASAFGGGATYDAKTGKLSAPEYAIGTDKFNNVGDALSKLANGGARAKYFNANSTLADSSATGTDSVAIGPNAVATNAGDVALGSGATTAAANATATVDINGTTYNFAGAAPTSVVSVGAAGAERQITNVAAGRVDAASTDAINGSQLFATNTELGAVNDRAKAMGDNTASAFGGGATYDAKTGKLSAPEYAIGTDKFNNVGDALSKLANGGARSKYFNANSTLADSTATGTDSVAIGPNAVATNAGDVALGSGATTAAANATATVDINGTTYNFAGTAPTSVVSVGAVGAERQITNVAAGRVDAASTDAINGSQLFATNTELGAVNDRAKALGDNTASAFGGGATYDAKTGKLSAPEYAIGTDKFNNVGDALSKLANGGARAKYFNANSTLADSTATGTDSVAIGPNAVATNAGDVALGSSAITAAANATATVDINGTTYNFAGAAPTSVVSVGAAGAERQITNVAAGRVDAASTDAVNGSQLFATNTELGAVNDRAKALGDNAASAFGGGATYDAKTGKLSAPEYAIGTDKFNNVGDALSKLANGGARAKYFNANSTLADSSATGTDSVAVGPAAVATGNNSLALGASAQSAGADAVAIGANAVASNAGDVALGGGSITAAANATASIEINGATYGFAGAAPGSVVSVGAVGAERQITNVAAGRISETSTDAVNGSQLFATNKAVTKLGDQMDAINNGGGIKYFRVNSTDADAVAGGVGSIAVGANASSAGLRSLAIGDGANAASDNSIALGAGSVAAAAVAVANGKIAGNTYAYAGAAPVGTVSVGAAGAERQLSNLAAGRVAADSTDAVNGSQLHATNQAVDKLDGRVGAVEGRVGNIENDLDDIRGGTVGPFRVSADAASGTPSATGKNSIAGGSKAVASGDGSVALGNDTAATGAGSVALGNGSVADRANTVSVGRAGSERQITNVAAGVNGTDAVNVNQLKSVTAGGLQYDTHRDGTSNFNSVTFNRGGSATGLHNVAAGVADTDAVNVGQLNRGLQDNLSQANAYTDRKTAEIQGDMWSLRRDMRGGVAAALAVAGLPQAYLPGKRMMAAALGSYQGEAGIAIGLSGITDDGHVIYKLQGTGNTSSGWGGSVGIGYQW